MSGGKDKLGIKERLKGLGGEWEREERKLRGANRWLWSGVSERIRSVCGRQ